MVSSGGSEEAGASVRKSAWDRRTATLRPAGVVPSQPLPRGRIIAGRYQLAEVLGEGGMGTVFRAEHLTLRKEVALKVVRPELITDATMAARFEREAYASSRISSPHVVTVHDYGRDGETPYLVMELLNGESLASRLNRESRLSVADSMRIASHVLRALTVAHEAGVVHRDLKPDNVFLTRDGIAKVLDFGIARLLESPSGAGPSSHVTIAGMIVGTPLYMSPEMVAHRPVGPAADMYALGVMLFEMLAGEPPFWDPEPVLLMGMHLSAPAPSLRERFADLELPGELDALVTQLLSKDPATRSSAADTLGTLDRLRANSDDSTGTIRLESNAPRRSGTANAAVSPPPGEIEHAPTLPKSFREADTVASKDVAAREVTPQGLVEPPRRSRPVIVGGGLVLVAALLGLGFVALSGAPESESEADRPPPPATEREPEKLPEPSIPEALRFRKSRTRFASSSPLHRRTPDSSWRRDVSTGARSSSRARRA